MKPILLSSLLVPSRDQDDFNLPSDFIQLFPDPNAAGGGKPQMGVPGAVPLFQTLDTASAQMFGRPKTIFVLVTTAIAHAAGQATVRPFTGFQKFAMAAAAGSSLPAAGTLADQVLIGAAAVNIGANAATLPVGLYTLSPATIAELQWEYPWLGLEFNFTAAVASGVMLAGIIAGPN